MSNLTNNTSGLQDILVAVEALPEAGGGGITPSGTKEITENGTYDVTNYASAEVNVPSDTPDTVEQATPSISVSSSGEITATSTQETGYVEGGTKTATKQLTTKGAATITPGSSEQTAVSAGTYVTGDIKVAAVDGGESSGANVEACMIDGTIEGAYSNDLAEDVRSHGFYNCKYLTKVTLPNVGRLEVYAFGNCTLLRVVDLAKSNHIDSRAFNNCSSLECLILRNTTQVATLNSPEFAFSGTPVAAGTGYIYVPGSLVDSYKAATSWSVYAAQIRAIEDYPDITGG